MRHGAIQIVLGVGGLGLLVWMLLQVDRYALWTALRPAGVLGVLVLIAFFAASQLPSCMAWRRLILPTLPFATLYRAFIIGDAFNLTVPSADTAGELAKVVVLRNLALQETLVASVTIHRLLELIAMSALLTFGLAVSWARLSISSWWFVLGVAMASSSLLLVLAFFAAQRGGGLYGPLLGRLIVRFGGSRATGRSIDARIRSCLAQRRTVSMSALLVLVSWVIGVGESYLCLRLLGLHPTWTLALGAYTFGLVATNLGFFVPGRLGVADGGRALAATSLGFDAPEATAFALLLRVRELAWAALGFALLLRARTASQLVAVE